MPLVMLAQVAQALGLVSGIISAGSVAMAQIKAILQAHSIEVDTSALDQVIADAERRKTVREQESMPNEPSNRKLF